MCHTPGMDIVAEVHPGAEFPPIAPFATTKKNNDICNKKASMQELNPATHRSRIILVWQAEHTETQAGGVC